MVSGLSSTARPAASPTPPPEPARKALLTADRMVSTSRMRPSCPYVRQTPRRATCRRSSARLSRNRFRQPMRQKTALRRARTSAWPMPRRYLPVLPRIQTPRRLPRGGPISSGERPKASFSKAPFPVCKSRGSHLFGKPSRRPPRRSTTPARCPSPESHASHGRYATIQFRFEQ